MLIYSKKLFRLHLLCYKSVSIHFITWLLVGFSLGNSLYAQESTHTAGGDIVSSGGSVAFSIGQSAYTTNAGSTGSESQGVQQKHEIAVVLRTIAISSLQTPWSLLPTFPTTVNIETTAGQFVRVGVNWNLSTLNIYRRGNYTLEGRLILPTFISNPSQLVAQLNLQVLPKIPPKDVVLSNSVFTGSADNFLIDVGNFLVEDPWDTVHEIQLKGRGGDNSLFEIKNNLLFWNSIDPVPGKINFRILVEVIDRDGNTLEKFFEITRIRIPSSALTISNTFTPNGDAANNTWGIPALRYFELVQIQIFDRGGLLVFSTENPDERWDGNLKGKLLPVGSYFWVIRVGETGESRKGIVNLLRY